MFAMIVFPLFRKKYTRKKIFTAAIIMIAVGYIGFFISPMNMLPIGICGVLIFIGEAFIQILMLMFLADCIEYGQWKNGKRNESITFSIQPFINKIGGAVASGIVGLTLVISGINRAEKVVDVADSGISMMKVAMMILPLVLIAISYLINIKKFKIDEVFHKQILDELTARGDIGGDSK
jgi:melibiose permease/lactose/raffinose/galactose permease